MAGNDFSKKCANFHSELNSLFVDELILTKQYCIGLKELSEVFTILPDRAVGVVRLVRNPQSAVGAKYEVEKVAMRLAEKYKLELVFE